MKKIIVGITGATGCIYGIRVLEALKVHNEVEIHLILSDYAKRIIETESDYTPANVIKMADFVYPFEDLGSRLASGSYITDGMIIAPCSIKSMSMVANSINDNLLVRAADVILKEKRKLVLMVRETPLHIGHLKLMLSLAEMGAVILPPLPAFYHKPKTIDDIVNQSVGKALDQFSIKHDLFDRWKGLNER